MPKTERQTTQKRAVEKYLASTRSHPSAEKVYLEVKKDIPTISKATVYRILRNFKKKGKIQEIPTDISRWDYKEDPHPHFICTRCDKLIDIDEELELPNMDHPQICQVENCRIVFCGICKDCEN